MKFWSSRLTLAVAGMSVAGFALASHAAAQEKPKTAGETFKNVTTSPLKGLSVDEFMGSMGVMAAALGWDCADCHEGAGTDRVIWEADTPRKVMARKMTEMVAVINKNNFGGAPMVSCWTCHHGRDIPATSIALDHLYGEPNDERDDIIPKDPQPQVSAEQVLDKYIQVLGGAQNLAGLTSFIATGTQEGYVDVKGGGQFQIFAKAPDSRTVQIRFPDAPDRGDQTRSFDGHTGIGWVTTPRALLGEYQVTGSELDGLKLDAELSFPGQIKQVLTNLRIGYNESIDGKEVQVVQGNGPRNLLATLFFEKSSGLLVRIIRYSRTPIGRVPTQVDYYDYRDVNGIKFPFKYKFSWLDGRDSFTISSVKTNVPIDESKFGKPSLGK
jgi:photosynthetic reaction center cytochrome c subunit